MMKQLKTRNCTLKVHSAKMNRLEKVLSEIKKKRTSIEFKLNTCIPQHYVICKTVMVMVSLKLTKFYLPGILKTNGATMGMPHQDIFRRILPNSDAPLHFLASSLQQSKLLLGSTNKSRSPYLR